MRSRPARSDRGRRGSPCGRNTTHVGPRRVHWQLVTDDIPRDQQSADLHAEQVPNLTNDPFMPSRVQGLEHLDRARFDATTRVQSAAAKDRYLTTTRQPLPGGAFSTSCPRCCKRFSSPNAGGGEIEHGEI
jgi:hypothetical protein